MHILGEEFWILHLHLYWNVFLEAECVPEQEVIMVQVQNQDNQMQYTEELQDGGLDRRA